MLKAIAQLAANSINSTSRNVLQPKKVSVRSAVQLLPSANSLLGFPYQAIRSMHTSHKMFPNISKSRNLIGTIGVLGTTAVMAGVAFSTKAFAEEKPQKKSLKELVEESERKRSEKIYTKMENPFAVDPNFNCLGCSPKNKNSFNLQFIKEENSKEVTTEFKPTKEHTGFADVVHGGVIATLIDETAFWAMFAYYEIIALTKELKVNYLLPVRPGVPLKVKGIVEKAEGKTIWVRVLVLDAAQNICADGIVTFIVPRADTMKRVLKIDDKSPLDRYII